MPTVDQRIPPLLAVATALAMLVITGWQGYRFWKTQSENAPLLQSTNTSLESGARTTVPNVALSELLLFGDAQSAKAQQNSSTEDLPETNLRLFLRGALAANGEYPASALIEGPGGDTEVYTAGERLPGNALLRTVLPNRVIIEREGKLENLYFPETEGTEGINLSSESIQDQEASPPRTQNNPPRPTDSVEERNRREEIRQRLEVLRQRLQENN